jgi:3-deoxy-D-manno-octulosonic-acid transferase
MKLIYNFLFYCLLPILKLVSFFNSKLNLGLEGRKNYQKEISKIPRENQIIWFHCASLGEFDQGLPLMNLFKKKYPYFQIVVTFFSPSGYLHYQKRKNPVDFALYLPFDTQTNAKEFLSLLKPKIGFFVKYEFWPNFLNEAKNQGIPVFSVATILRPNQIYFKWYGGLFRNALKNVDYFFTQNKETGDLLEKMGIKNYHIIGDTRFDRVLQNKMLFEQTKSSSDFDIFNRFLGEEKAIIFGSSWSTEEQILFSYLAENKSQKVILAPHNVSESNIESLQNKLGKNAVRFTKFESDFDKQQVLILNTIGHLSTAYSFGKVAFVGGGFSGSLHNILEPAVFGLPVFFGPKHEKFPEANEFINQGIGFQVKSFQEFKKKLNEIEPKLNSLYQKTIEYVENQQGASTKIIEHPKIKKLFD